MKTVTLSVDSRKRICLTKILGEENISSVRVYRDGGKIILEPMVEVPVSEVWLYKNKKALKRVNKGLTQRGAIKRSSFSKYAKKNV